MLTFIQNPSLAAFVLVFLILFTVGIFALGASWGKALLGSALLAAVGVGAW